MSNTTENPFSPYTRLSSSIYLVPPRTTTTTTTTTTPTPSTIILCLWYAAPARALVKYVAQYALLAPSSRIIFILSGPRDFYLYPTQASHRRRLQPAIELLLQEQTTDPNSSAFIHLFSNGGMFTTAQLLLAYRHASSARGGNSNNNNNNKPLRISGMLFDSAPGVTAPSRSLKALAYGLPQMLMLRQLLYGVLAVMVWGGWILRRLILRREDPFAFTRRATLDERLVVAAAAADGDGKDEANDEDGDAVIKSCYIYSESDDLVPWKDVEEHAALAVVKGRKVALEKFNGSPHVGHMRQDPERYWAIVKKYLSC